MTVGDLIEHLRQMHDPAVPVQIEGTCWKCSAHVIVDADPDCFLMVGGKLLITPPNVENHLDERRD